MFWYLYTAIFDRCTCTFRLHSKSNISKLLDKVKNSRQTRAARIGFEALFSPGNLVGSVKQRKHSFRLNYIFLGG